MAYCFNAHTEVVSSFSACLTLKTDEDSEDLVWIPLNDEKYSKNRYTPLVLATTPVTVTVYIDPSFINTLDVVVLHFIYLAII